MQTDYDNFELLLVDNGSTNKEFKKIINEFKNYPNFKTLLLDVNKGYAAGNNIGARNISAASKYIIFMNNDVRVNPNWLTPLVSVMEAHPEVGIAQPKLLLMSDERLFDCAGGYIDCLGFAHEKYRCQPDDGRCDKIVDIFYAKGAALIIRSDLWSQLHGFEELFSLYYEETDLCWRARLCGFRVILVPTSSVFHASGVTIKHFLDKKILYYDTRNRFITMISNYSAKNLKYVPISLIWHLFIGLYVDLYKDRCADCFTYRFKGVAWCLKNAKWLYLRRRYIQSIRKASDKLAIENILLRWSYVFGIRRE